MTGDMNSVPAAALDNNASTTVSVVPSAARADSSLALIRPVAALQVQLELQKEVEGLIRSLLTEDVDYGTTPGTKTPSLYKPGAERICIAFGCRAEFEVVEKNVDHDVERRWEKRWKKWAKDGKSFTWNSANGVSQGFYRYVYRCRIIQNGTDRVLATEDGCCSTAESKYCDRPLECENTVMKMAQKRAHVGAVLRAFGLSNRFGQGDDEDDDRGPAPSTATAAQSQPANYNGTEAERAELDRHLGEQDVPREFWDEVHRELVGKPRARCGAVIAAVLKKHEEPRK